MENNLKSQEEVDQWEETMFLYDHALKKMALKAQMMNDEFVCRYHYNPIEVQIRSVAMDFWASLEHKIAYKFEGDAPEALLRELRACADIVDILDDKMYSLHEALLAITEKRNSPANRP